MTKTCPFGDKNAYGKSKAKRMSRGITVRRKKKLRTYECPHCHNWHITSEKKYG